ncbi:YjcG family protein [Solibacillus sp. CAU 1738]|uniref:YjcG family protein n=1 Tax=Solibacillus sp. CAU 1738 TaxID=3140363 RepID=UPI003261A4B6
MKYGIVAFPSNKLQDLANNYRKRYDPHYAQIAPHMTLKDAFEADESKLEEITSKLSEIASKYAPLTIHASRISSFFPTTNAIFFRVEPTDQLASIHSALQEQITYGTSKHVFVPHITIAQKLSSAEHDDIFGQLRMAGINEKETIDSIHLLKEDNGKWVTIETFRLSGVE